MSLEEWRKEHTKILQNGHTINNYGIKGREWESWEDTLGNFFDKKNNKITVMPKEVLPRTFYFNCICPFCNEEVEIEMEDYYTAGEEAECPECENHFEIYHEN